MVKAIGLSSTGMVCNVDVTMAIRAAIHSLTVRAQPLVIASRLSAIVFCSLVRIMINVTAPGMANTAITIVVVIVSSLAQAQNQFYSCVPPRLSKRARLSGSP
jgi:hypothetical protein